MGVINTLELEGVSGKSWGDAAREALREASKTIRHINRLEVLGTSNRVEEGQIVDKGSHAELLASSAQYRSIYESQLGAVPVDV